MLPDRFADRLVANLQSFCTFRKGGCQWVGKRGDMCGHLARECQMVIVACPHNCGTELPRHRHHVFCGACISEWVDLDGTARRRNLGQLWPRELRERCLQEGGRR